MVGNKIKMNREKLVSKLNKAQEEFDFFYNKGVRSATVMGVLQAEVNVARAEIGLVDAQYKIN